MATTPTPPPSGDFADQLRAAFANAAAPSAPVSIPALVPAPPPVATTPVVEPAPAPAVPPATPPLEQPAPAAPEPVAPPEFDPDALDFDKTADPTATPATPASTEPVPPLVSPEEQATLAEALTPEQATALEEALKSDKVLETVSLRSERGKRQLQAFKTVRELADGLGHTPTLEELRTYHEDHLTVEAMAHEFEANPGSWLLNHFAPDAQTGQFRPGAIQVLQEIHRVLPQAAPKLYQQTVAIPVLAEAINRAYAWADTLTGQNLDAATQVDDRVRVLNAARIMEHFVFGTTRPDPTSPTLTGSPAANDPLAAERTALQQQKAAYERQLQASQTARSGQFDTQVSQTSDQAVLADIDKFFQQAGLTDHYKGAPAVLGALRTQLMNQVLDATFGAPQVGTAPQFPAALKEFQIQLSRAKRDFDITGRMDLTAPLNTYRQMTQQVIRRLAKPFLKEAAVQAVQDSSARHTALAAGATRTAPAPGSGVPVPQSVLPAPTPRQPGEDVSDYYTRTLREEMQRAGKRV